MSDPGRPCRTFVPLVCLVAATAAVVAQEPEGTWLEPPAVIARLAAAPNPPQASLSPQGQHLVLTTRESLPDLAVLARPHLKLAGMRVDAATFGRELGAMVTAVTIQRLPDGAPRDLGIEPGHWSGPIWSADERAFAMVRQVDGGGELWLADPCTEPLVRVDGLHLNQVLGGAVQWLPDQKRLLVKQVVAGRAPRRPAVPPGPRVQTSTRGRKAQVRTYQDLLQDDHDAALLEFYGTSRLGIVDASTRAFTPIGAPAMYDRVEPSPDGEFLLAETVERPFSFVVPLSQFPGRTQVLSIAGEPLRTLHEHALLDAVPIGGVPRGPRGVDWVPSLQHALVWREAQDGGDPRAEAPHRDHVFLLAEPDGTPRLWFKTEHRAGGLQFGSDGQLVLAGEFDRKTRVERLWRFDLGAPFGSGQLLLERSTQDAYGDPGRPLTERTVDGRTLLRMLEGRLLLAGAGASPTGERPFLDAWDVASGEKQRLFESPAGRLETVLGFVGGSVDTLVVRSESQDAPPSIVLLDRAGGARRELHAAKDPAHDWISRVQRRLVHYEREDGVPMSGTLYLPAGYEEGQKLPCLVWAYPREYTKASDAGQVRAAPNRYLQLRGSSHLFLLLHGYAVFDNASMPIVGPQRTANDTFVEQVRMNARAAVAALTKEGCVDPKRIAVAGHSYGAFMTANLLAHTDLFACGIARSGAYNRTLTPFGFQNEERTYWEAPEVYQAMSPFSHAHRIDEPLLLIHGEDDNNSGTFPIQSERLFMAIQGHGGPVRLCMLPNESHGYRGRQTVLHCLAEMCRWLDAHCKGRG